MTKDVLVSISGMHEEIVAVTPEVEDDENEAMCRDREKRSFKLSYDL